MENQRVTNLAYLKDLTGGEPSIIREMVELFIAQMPEFSENLKSHLAQKRYIELGQEAHKLKSSVLVVGMEETAKKLKQLQLLTEKGEDIDNYPKYVNDVIEVCEKAVNELKIELEKL